MIGGPSLDAPAMSSAQSPPDSRFEPVHTRKAFEGVIQQITDQIQAGLLGEGDELPGERALAATMEVSRPTIRSAVSALSEAGVIEVRPGRAGGMKIKSIWIPDGLTEKASDPRQEETYALLEARRTIEPRVAQLAALRGTEEQFDKMQESIDLQSTNFSDRRKAVQAEFMYHRLMWQAAHNSSLEAMLQGLYKELEPVMDMAMRTHTDQETAVAIHEETLAALRRGDPDEVAEAMDSHMSYLERIAEDVFGRKRIRETPDFLSSAEDSVNRVN
jgi:DNA-binding FadR family transcriptional regulator